MENQCNNSNSMKYIVLISSVIKKEEKSFQWAFKFKDFTWDAKQEVSDLTDSENEKNDENEFNEAKKM